VRTPAIIYYSFRTRFVFARDFCFFSKVNLISTPTINGQYRRTFVSELRAVAETREISYTPSARRPDIPRNRNVIICSTGDQTMKLNPSWFRYGRRRPIRKVSVVVHSTRWVIDDAPIVYSRMSLSSNGFTVPRDQRCY